MRPVAGQDRQCGRAVSRSELSSNMSDPVAPFLSDRMGALLLRSTQIK